VRTLKKIAFMRVLKIVVMLTIMTIVGYSQDSKVKRTADYKIEPVWIKMMDDPNVDYNEAVRAFNIYWSDKIEPEEEQELITEGKFTKLQLDSAREVRSKWSQAQLNEYMEMKYQFKRFKNWKRINWPYVQSDGRILSEQERIEIYQQQQKDRKKEK
jgi:hypothetical protein